ncbi:MAG: DUF2867 domain-containing protein [Thermomonas sp.]
MPTVSRPARGFPTARIEHRSGGLPVEVSLVAQLGHGAGDALFRQTGIRQRGQASFIDALDEPSARIAATDFARGESTALFSFSVGAEGHPFHRHAGHRVFTAISGSGGAQLCFSTASTAAMQASPRAFVDALHHVDIPPDCLFTVRFGSGTWHRFMPAKPGHPALFAVSCHTDERGGIDDPALAALVTSGKADIPSLTELLPDAVLAHLQANPTCFERVPTIALSLESPPGGPRDLACNAFRRFSGRLRGIADSLRTAGGFVARRGHAVTELAAPPSGSLLSSQLSEGFEHEDSFELVLRASNLGGHLAQDLLADVLQGFLSNRPTGVSWLMGLRNVLVRPLRLRTSPLGCPVSSLLSPDRGNFFADRYPVLDQAIDPRGLQAQVLLGADDRHLRFRSCVGVRIAGNEARITLGTRVQARNLFGRAYMASIEGVHRRYVSPAMLCMAVEHAQRQLHPDVDTATAVAF